MANLPDTTDEGIDRLRAVVRANPRSTAFVALAHALCDAGKAGEAEEVCRAGLGQHPRLVTGQVALGRSLLERGRLREAQEVLIEAAKAGPENADVFRWLGEVLLRRGDADHARPVLEYAEELSPSESRIAELLKQAGGRPSVRPSRPKTDFEHTRVGNARALAARMHEEPEGPAPSAPPARHLPPAPLEGNDEPTIVSSSIPPLATVQEPAAPHTNGVSRPARRPTR